MQEQSAIIAATTAPRVRTTRADTRRRRNSIIQTTRPRFARDELVQTAMIASEGTSWQVVIHGDQAERAPILRFSARRSAGAYSAVLNQVGKALASRPGPRKRA